MPHSDLFFKTEALRQRLEPHLGLIPPFFEFTVQTGAPEVRYFDQKDPMWKGFPFPVPAGTVYVFDDAIPARALGGGMDMRASVRVTREDRDDEAIILRIWHEIPARDRAAGGRHGPVGGRVADRVRAAHVDGLAIARPAGGCAVLAPEVLCLADGAGGEGEAGLSSAGSSKSEIPAIICRGMARRSVPGGQTEAHHRVRNFFHSLSRK